MAVIKKQAFTLALLPPPPTPGEVVYLTNSTTQTYSWVVPDGVTLISAVCVSMFAATTEYVAAIKRGATVLLSANSTLGSGGVGGGNGGAKGTTRSDGTYNHPGGGGGAGGYSGSGGAGGTGTNVNGSRGGTGSAGAGGGGGGGSGADTYNTTTGSYMSGAYGAGGGVGLQGIGANGAGGDADVSSGKGGQGSNLGGSAVCGAGTTGQGGNLRWLNDIPVTPGETLTIDLGIKTGTSAQGANTGVRIMFGNDGRSYPSNAGDAIPKGQAVITLANTTWTVPPGVTSICACAQQQDGSKAAVTLVVGGVTVLRAQNGARIGDGGGDGGASPGGSAGGGGGGGYGGDGGANGANGTGGSGAGGQDGGSYWVTDPVWGPGSPGGHWETVAGRPGGGVGISGQGASGTTANPQGSPDPVNGYMGGGPQGTAGGALAYKNAIAVTPGQVLTVNAAGGRMRLIWGPGRSYPSAAGNV